MDHERQQTIDRVKTYLEEFDNSPLKVTTTVKGWLELSTEQIRVLLAALSSYHSPDKEKMQMRDELLNIFFKS